MKNSQNNLFNFTHNGTSLRSRQNKYLDVDYFKLDDREVSDLIAYSKSFTKHIKFIDKDASQKGNWESFFENNLAFLISDIATIDTVELDYKFQIAVDALKQNTEPDKEKLKDLFILIFDLFDLVNTWYVKSKTDIVHLSENILYRQLSNSITTTLKGSLNLYQQKLIAFEETFLNSSEFIDVSTLDEIWFRRAETDLYKNLDYQIDTKILFKELAVLHNSVFGFLQYMKSVAPGILNRTLEEYPYHSPHISLFISFLQVFRYVQKDLNGITEKQLDHYYFDILGQELKLSEPDKVLVYLNPVDGVRKQNIPEGTLLFAGIDENGYEYTYKTAHGIELNQATISDLKIIHVVKNDSIIVGDSYNYISNIYDRNIIQDEEGKALDNFNNPQSFHSLGRDQSEISLRSRDMEKAKIGFAISSPILKLSEGERKVNIFYRFDLNSLSSFISFSEDLSRLEGLSAESSFQKLLSNVFNIRVTSPEGWFETDQYRIFPPSDWVKGEIELQLDFDIGDPSIISYDPLVHGEGYNTNWPVIEFTISSEKAMYPYSFLKDLVVEDCEINVQVRRLRNINAFSELGALDINQPFFPFGSTPDVGSYLLIGHEEMFQKNISDLSIEIEWNNLPKEQGGFESYYKSYKNDVKNDSFNVSIQSLVDYEFRPLIESNSQSFQLFVEDDKTEKVLSKTLIKNIDIERLEIKRQDQEINTEEYTSQSKTGFFKLELDMPSDGFGHKLYPLLVVESAQESTSNLGILGSKVPKPFIAPNIPLALQARSLSINYSATTSFTMSLSRLSENDKESNDQIYHIHPFGNVLIFDKGIPEENYLISQYSNEGYLFIGLENLNAPVELSLYFELDQNIQNDINHSNILQLQWRYLVEDTWFEFEDNEMLHDGTNNLSISGIVILKIPTMVDKKHNILPSGKYWICATTKDNTNFLSKIKLVHNNGITATWSPHAPGAYWKKNIDAYSINRLIKAIDGVLSVNQPFSSFGGRKKETKQSFYQRVSDSLAHKNRAITALDIEKIVLSHFPSIFQVKCLTYISHPEDVKIGSVRVVVIPKISSLLKQYPPRVDYFNLKKIQGFLEKMTSPNCKVEVISTVFEKVRISCKIKPKTKGGSGEFIRRLEEDLRLFICPWLDKEQKEMMLESSIERDDILSYLLSLDYVDYVTKLSVVIIHFKDGKYSLSDSAFNNSLNNRLTSSSPWSVLIPSEDHEWEIIDTVSNEIPEETKINTMKIESDFVIVDEEDKELVFPFYDLAKDTYYYLDLNV